MTFKEILLLNGGIVAGFVFYKYFQWKNAMKEIDGLISRKKHSVNTALFFCASGLGDCDKHIYKKKMCEKSDCPYRKLRHSLRDEWVTQMKIWRKALKNLGLLKGVLRKPFLTKLRNT